MSVNVYIHTRIMWLQISVKTNASLGWKIDLWCSNSHANLKSHGSVNTKSMGNYINTFLTIIILNSSVQTREITRRWIQHTKSILLLDNCSRNEGKYDIPTFVPVLATLIAIKQLLSFAEQCMFLIIIHFCVLRSFVTISIINT